MPLAADAAWRRGTAARIGLAGEGEFTALDYVGAREARDGSPSPLIAQWDGIENDGWGQPHVDGANFVTNLVTGVRKTAAALSSDATSIIYDGTAEIVNLNMSRSPIWSDGDVPTVEIVFTAAADAGGDRYANLVYWCDAGYDGLAVSCNGVAQGQLCRVGIVQTGKLTADAYSIRPSTMGVYANGGGTRANSLRLGTTYGTWITSRLAARIHSMRFYDRALTPDERTRNAEIDKARFGI